MFLDFFGSNAHYSSCRVVSCPDLVRRDAYPVARYLITLSSRPFPLLRLGLDVAKLQVHRFHAVRRSLAGGMTDVPCTRKDEFESLISREPGAWDGTLDAPTGPCASICCIVSGVHGTP